MSRLEDEAAEAETVHYSPEQAAEIRGENQESLESMAERQARVWVKTDKLEGGMLRGNVVAGDRGLATVRIENPQDPNHKVLENVSEVDLRALQEEGMKIELEQIMREGHDVWVRRSGGEYQPAKATAIEDSGVRVVYAADEKKGMIAHQVIPLQEFAKMQNGGLAQMYKDKHLPIRVERGDRGSGKFQEGRVTGIREDGMAFITFEDPSLGDGWGSKYVKVETLMDWQEESPKQ